MDTLSNMRAFLAVVSAGNFTKAAQSLSISPSVISKRINQLEYELGGALFKRTTHYVVLTDFGEMALPDIRSVVSKYEVLLETGSKRDALPQGKLRIKVPTVLMLAVYDKLLWEFKELYPEIEMQIVLIDRPIHLDNEGFDVALTIGQLPHQNVVQERLAHYERMFVATDSYYARHGVPKVPRDLENHICLFVEQEGASWAFDSLNTPRVRFRPHISSNSALTLLSAVSAGRGLGLLWKELAQPMVDKGELTQCLADYRSVDRWVNIQASRERINIRRISVFFDFMTSKLGAGNGQG